MNIIVYYSCSLCGLTKIGCQVRARENESVIDWMNTMGLALSNDHRRRSPDCHPIQLDNIMIPITGADKIGGPELQ